MLTSGAQPVKGDDYESLFAKMREVQHVEVVRASEEIARLSEPIRALAEATAEIARPRFTTFIST